MMNPLKKKKNCENSEHVYVLLVLLFSICPGLPSRPPKRNPVAAAEGARKPLFIIASVCSVGGINNVAGFIYILAPVPDTLARRRRKTSGWLQGKR